MKTAEKLTEQQHWDDYWNSIELPLVIEKTKDKLLLNEELKIFDKYLPHKPLSVLEIGGAPGQYLAYMHRQFGYEIHCLDYSPTGCRKTEENFALLEIPVKVYKQDIFSDLGDLPQFDVVFSMGLIEHFQDLTDIVKRHNQLLKPGGTLILGIPNFTGINHLFLKRLAPNMLSWHNLKTMDIRTWSDFENELNLEILFKDYVGGFEPMTFLVKEKPSLINNLLFLKARILNRIFHKNFPALRKYNSRHFSGYILGVFRKS